MPKRKALDEEGLDIGEAPTTINPYEVLAVAEDASAEQIRSAYRKAALKHHPDKATEQDKHSAHQKFQEIALAYAVLSDERRRRRYDTTGRVDESLDLDDDDFDWTSYFREQFSEVVTTEAIQRFANEYKGGNEERGHVLQAYVKHQGSMEKLYQEIMLSNMLDDEERFRAIIDQAIAEGEVESFRKYAEESEASRKRRMDRERKRKAAEAEEAEEASKELDEKDKRRRKGKKAENGGGMGDLAAMIQQRQKGRAEDFFSNLEAKYAPAGKKGKKPAPMDEPPEEAFAKNAKKKGAAPEEARDRTGRSKRARK